MIREAAFRRLAHLTLIFVAAAGATPLRAAAAQAPAASAASAAKPPNEDGYDLWLRYRLVSDTARRAEYRASISRVVVLGNSPSLRAAGGELATGLSGLLGRNVPRDNA